MNKIPYPSQNTEAKTLPADVCIFGHFGWLSPAAVYSADCRFDSGVKWWIHVSSIVAYLHKNSFFVALSGIHFEHSFLIVVNTLPSYIFNSSAIPCNFNLQPAKMSFGVFQDNWWIWVTWVFSIISVCTTTFKVSIQPLNCCFWWTRVWITLIKPLLCLNSIFSPQKAMLYQHTKFRFFHCFENLQQ